MRDEQARGPANGSAKRHLTQVDKCPCPGDTSTHSGLDTTVACTRQPFAKVMSSM
jgi:hypothetical protein